MIAAFKVFTPGPLLPAIGVALFRATRGQTNLLVGRLPDGRAIEIEGMGDDRGGTRPYCIMKIGEWRNIMELDAEWKAGLKRREEAKKNKKRRWGCK
jgi:hypothetical protein